MGKITRFIIRWGATGSTARWVAKHYLRLKEAGVADNEILYKLVEFRYETFSLKAKAPLVERLDYLDNLVDFTFSILQLEGVIKTDNMPRSTVFEITEVITGELEKLGVKESTRGLYKY